MISVIVVGRNDNHGYNLGKRVASSLNSIAMRLSFGDEIIFVDWNTPRPSPPMPVAIFDDLTDETKKFLRVIVVKPEIHNAVKGESSKNILEPLARNVGIRRANPDNYWVLSTNTDILLIGSEELKLQSALSKLDERLWQSFRYELPEYIWETLDKRDPRGTNNKIYEISKAGSIKLNLLTYPTGKKADNLCFADAIGDFQLAPRQLWLSIRGFPEEMLSGWHVDSRAAVQMIRQSGVESRIVPSEFGLSTYHQNHLRTLTHFHLDTTMNSIELITKRYENSENWGLGNVELYEFPLSDFMGKIHDLHFQETRSVDTVKLQEAHEDCTYNIERAFIFLVDELITLKPNEVVTVITVNQVLIERIRAFLEPMSVRINTFNELTDFSSVRSSVVSSTLTVIDFGVDVSSKELSGDKLLAGEIAINIQRIADSIKPNQRVALIKAQRWAIRTLIQKFFVVPLFNNYSCVLTGARRPVNAKSEVTRKTLLLWGIRSDYGLVKKPPLLFVLFYDHVVKRVVPRKIRDLVIRQIINK
jgi:hypothetical protein